MEFVINQLRRLLGFFLLRFFVYPSVKSDALFMLTIEILAQIAAVDGKISAAEISTIENYARDHLGVSKEKHVKVLRTLRNTRKSPKEFRKHVSTLYQAVTGNKILLEAIFDVILAVAYADGVFRKEERALWEQALLICKFTPDDMRRMLARHMESQRFAEYVNSSQKRSSQNRGGYRKVRGRRGAASQRFSSQYQPRCYEILGAKQSDTFDSIKKRYRKLAKESHPDKVVGLGAPEEFRKTVEARFREIQTAYEEVCRLRGES
jgi:DnaJ like chaperone protein